MYLYVYMSIYLVKSLFVVVSVMEKVKNTFKFELKIGVSKAEQRGGTK